MAFFRKKIYITAQVSCSFYKQLYCSYVRSSHASKDMYVKAIFS